MNRSFIGQKLWLEDKGVISLVGSGGKTTLMFSLAKWMRARGKRVITTTTTKIFMPAPTQTPAVVFSEKPEQLFSQAEKLLDRYGHMTAGAGHLADQNKIKGLSPEIIDALSQSGIADWIVVEADGSAGRPLKAPAPHEPVIPAQTRLLMAVIGLAGIGKPLDESNVFRTNIFASLTNLSLQETITASSVAAVILHDEGIMKGAPAGADKLVFLNKAEREECHAAGEEVASLLLERGADKLSGVVIGSASQPPDCWQRLDGKECRDRGQESRKPESCCAESSETLEHTRNTQ